MTKRTQQAPANGGLTPAGRRARGRATKETR